MPVPASGQVSISDLVDEFGGTAPHSLSEYYRDAGLVPGNNTSVPASGLFRLSNARGAVNEIAVAATSSTNVNLSTLFGANWTSTVPKRLTVGSGVTIGGTGSSAAIIIPSNMAGTLEIDNDGSILGFGGAANGGNGGNAISNSASGVTINNTGTIAGGGGGGGQGGAGGTGGSGLSYSYGGNVYNGANNWNYLACGGTYLKINSSTSVYCGLGSTACQLYSNPERIYAFGSTTSGWIKGTSYGNDYNDGCRWYIWGIRTFTEVATTGGSGGSGGSGGVGQGYNQTNASGSSGAAGAAGGTDAGTGGTGGTGGNGGTYGNSGTSGSTGSTGANGTQSNGSAGSSGSGGGSAGAAVAGTAVTMNNTGSLYGAVA